MLWTLDERLEALREVAKGFAKREVAPRAASIDRSAQYPEDLFDAMRSAELLGLPIPEEYGGSGAGMAGLVVAIEEVTRYCQSAGLMLLLSRLAAGPVLILGSEEQRRRYAAGVASGALRGSFCLTEPDAGSDTSAMKATAITDGRRYVLNGTKCYISGATVADFFIVWARVPDESGPHNIAGFIVDRDAAGVSVGRSDEKMGARGVPTAEVILDDAQIPVSARLTAPGQGFRGLMATLNSARPGVAARGLGLTAGALEYSVGYARDRVVFGEPLIEKQNTQFVVADVVTHLEAARCLVYGAARMVDEGSFGKGSAPYIAMAKRFATDLAVRASSQCLQVLGAAGYMGDHPMERYYRDAKQLQIVEGTSEIQAIIIGRGIRDGLISLA